MGIEIKDLDNLHHFRLASEVQKEAKGGYLKADIQIPDPLKLDSIELTLVWKNKCTKEYVPHCNMLFISEFGRKPKPKGGQTNKDITAKDHTVTLKVNNVNDGNKLRVVSNHNYLLAPDKFAHFGPNAWDPSSGTLKLDKEGVRLTVIKAQEKNSSSRGIYVDEVLKEKELDPQTQRPDSKAIKSVCLKVTAHYQDGNSLQTISDPIFNQTNYSLKVNMYHRHFCNTGEHAIILQDCKIEADASVMAEFATQPRLNIGMSRNAIIGTSKIIIPVVINAQELPNVDGAFYEIPMRLFLVVDDFKLTSSVCEQSIFINAKPHSEPCNTCLDSAENLETATKKPPRRRSTLARDQNDNKKPRYESSDSEEGSFAITLSPPTMANMMSPSLPITLEEVSPQAECVDFKDENQVSPEADQALDDIEDVINRDSDPLLSQAARAVEEIEPDTLDSELKFDFGGLYSDGSSAARYQTDSTPFYGGRELEKTRYILVQNCVRPFPGRVVDVAIQVPEISQEPSIWKKIWHVFKEQPLVRVGAVGVFGLGISAIAPAILRLF